MRTIKIADSYDYDYDYNYDDKYDSKYDGPSSPYQTTINLYDDNTGEEQEVLVSVDFDLQPTETEGSFVRINGYAIINSIKLSQDVEIGGVKYPFGTDYEDLNEFINYDLEGYINEKLIDDGLVIPTRHYPRN